MRHLAADLGDGSRQFLGRRRHGLHIGRAFVGRGGNGAGLLGGLFRRDAHGLGGGLHLAGLAGHGLHHALNLGVEILGQPVDGGAAVGRHALGHFLLFLQPVAFDHIVLEDLQRLGHLADLVMPARAFDHGAEIVAGQLGHGNGHAGDGAHHAQ